MSNPHALKSGLIGRGIGATRSPQIHEGEAALLGQALAYRAIDFTALDLPDADLEQTVRSLVADGYSGCNVTFPFKQAVMAICDSLSEAASVLGAVNTLVFRDGSIHGENTDWQGFTWQIQRDIGSIAGTRIAQVGSGGAGSATAFALARLGADEVALHDPLAGRAEQLAARLAPHFPSCRFVVCDSVADAIAGSQGVVNATPVGMASVPGTPFDPALLEPGQWLADIIYFPLETKLLAAARSKGHIVANGVSMVVGQAAEAFRLITGLQPDRERMLDRLNTAIAAERKTGEAA